MNEYFLHPVYSKNVIEFVTVCREFCNWLENLTLLHCGDEFVVELDSENEQIKEFQWKALKMLPLLYLKASVLEKHETVLDEFLEKFVSESDYECIRIKIKTIMGKYDDYLEVFTNDIKLSETPLISSVSENFADIYQDIKDFLLNYRTAITEIMNDALYEIITQFETFWGQRLLNVLRAIHQIYYEISD